MHNTYYLLRHGESLKNVKDIASCWPEKFYFPLTKRGKESVEKAARSLKGKSIDLIFSSDILRTKQTAEIVSKELEIKLEFDKRLREGDAGIFNGKPISEVGDFWNKGGRKLSPRDHYLSRFRLAPPKGENYVQIERRMNSFLKDIDKKYSRKRILIVGHQRPISLLEKAVSGQSRENFVKKMIEKKEIKMGEVRKLRAR